MSGKESNGMTSKAIKQYASVASDISRVQEVVPVCEEATYTVVGLSVREICSVKFQKAIHKCGF